VNEHDDISFFIGGYGLHYETMKEIITKNNLGDKIEMVGWIPHKMVNKYLNEMKLLVLPSYSEGLPTIILEAMACGTPVLATPVGAVPDIIEDGETGFLLKSNDPKHIAEKIIELLNKPELLEKVSINAYNYVRENFSYGKILKSWKRLLQEIDNR